MAHAGHTRHIERVYCPFGQYAAFAGLWPGGPYALRCRYGPVGHTRHIERVYIFQ